MHQCQIHHLAIIMKKISCKWRNDMPVFRCIRCCTYILFGFSLLAIVYTLCNAAAEYYIDLFSKQSYITFIQLFAPFSALFYGTIITATAYVALMVYHKSQKVEEAQALRDVRTMLNSKENMEIHCMLMKENDSKTLSQLYKRFEYKEAKLFNYIGTLEYVYLLIQSDVISIDTAKKQFGYRVEEIQKDAELMEYLNDTKEYWQDFFALMNKLKQQ